VGYCSEVSFVRNSSTGGLLNVFFPEGCIVESALFSALTKEIEVIAKTAIAITPVAIE
jgi:hypothetical protein